MHRIPLLLCLTCLTAGCNTFEGVGEDLTSVGDSMTEFARDVRGDGPGYQSPPQQAPVSAPASAPAQSYNSQMQNNQAY